MVTLIQGSQWGDEGKGKITDILAADSDYVVRFHGGNNAGHTIINKYGTFPLHLVPSGICQKKPVCLISGGVVVDPEVLTSEIDLVKKAGVKVLGRLFISPRCHLIMPYHKIFDRLYEEAKGKGKTGTTGRGIGPVYADKVSYNGLRIWDLLDNKIFAEKLKIQLKIKNKIIAALDGQALHYKDVFDKYQMFGKTLKPYIAETFGLIQRAIEKKKNILLEGAHGVFLDNDWGTYPYVTASTVVSGGVTPGAGIAPRKIDKVVGVVKAYTTRVGEGPFPTELFDKTGEKLRKEGAEFGTTTGRPRRCGWFDAELVRFAAQVNGFTEIALTKLDVLDSFSEIKICTGYTLGGKRVYYQDGDAQFLGRVKPEYIKVKGWNQPIRGIKKFEKLPRQTQVYLTTLEKLIGVKVAYISNGPKREEIIKR